MDFDTRNGNTKHKILEDVFESFCAVVEMILDKKFGIGVGYATCFEIISKIFDEMDIRIDYFSLNNPIMTLKEIYDELVTNGQRSKEDNLPVYVSRPTHIEVLDIVHGKKTLIGSGKGKTVELAKQEAARQAVSYFNKLGIAKRIPEAYLKFCV